MVVLAWILTPLALGFGFFVLFASAMKTAPELDWATVLVAGGPVAITMGIAWWAGAWIPFAACGLALAYLGWVVVDPPVGMLRGGSEVASDHESAIERGEWALFLSHAIDAASIPERARVLDAVPSGGSQPFLLSVLCKHRDHFQVVLMGRDDVTNPPGHRQLIAFESFDRAVVAVSGIVYALCLDDGAEAWTLDPDLGELRLYAAPRHPLVLILGARGMLLVDARGNEVARQAFAEPAVTAPAFDAHEVFVRDERGEKIRLPLPATESATTPSHR